MYSWKPAPLPSDDLLRNEKCFYEVSFCLPSLCKAIFLLGKSLEFIFIHKRNDERETSLWQSIFSIPSIPAYFDTQSPKYMSNGCLILPVNAHEYSRSALPKNWCRNCLFGRAYYFFIKMFYLCKILDKNFWKTGMNGCPKWERILHFWEYHILRYQILQPVMF